MSEFAPPRLTIEEYEKRRMQSWEENEDEWAFGGFHTPPEWQQQQDAKFMQEQAEFERNLLEEANQDKENRVQFDIHLHVHKD